jgi:transcriptional regulator, TetR family
MPRVKAFDEKVVLEKAMELFWKQGFHATSMQDLVSHLGINRASLYDTYGGKKALFLKTFQHYRNINQQFMSTFLNAEPDVRKGLRKLLMMAVQQAKNDADFKGCFAVNNTVEFVPNDPDMLEVLQENKQQLETIFLNYLQKGVATSQMSPNKDLKTVASLLFTFFNGLRITTKIEVEEAQLNNSIQMIIGLLD